MNPYEYEKGKYIDIVLSGEETRLHPGNTHVFNHSLQTEGNHIYVIHREIDDTQLEASYLWRMNFEQQGRGEKYDNLASRLGKIGCEVHEAVFMSEHDIERFKNCFGRLANMDVKEHQLTDRHERLITNLGRTLRTIPAKDFHEEMASPHDYRPHPPRWI